MREAGEGAVAAQGDRSARVRFCLLGPLAVLAGDERVEIPGATAPALLVALLLRPDGYTGAGHLISTVWGHSRVVAEDSVYHYMSRLRKILAPVGLDIPKAQYRLPVPDESVDARRFSRLVGSAAALRDSNPEEALHRLRNAMSLWRGPFAFPELHLSGVRALGHRLDCNRLDAEEMLAGLELRLGRPEASVDRLREVAAAHPGHPGIAAALIAGLHATGRSGEAERVYRQAVQRYGARMPAKIGQAHSARSGPAAPMAAGQPAGWHVPDQIPPVARYFTGRERELARLTSVRAEPANATVVRIVTGTAGVGKTALALHAARLMLDAGRFPDGGLFVDLRGFSGSEPVDPVAALEWLLQSLGVPGDRVPAELDARAALYRTVVARRRVLIVLDNARDEAQVRPLLPGTAHSQVLVTSQRRLAGLDDADLLNIDVLPVPEAVRLFRAMVLPRDAGPEQAVEEIVTLCGLLPLAIRIAGARLKTTRALTAEHVLGQLRTEQGRLPALDDGERSVAAAFAVSHQHLTGEQHLAFALLGLHPGPEFEPYSAAALLDLTESRARHLLDALEQVNLVEQPAAGRYRFHDLVRSYASTTFTGADPDRLRALGRLYDLYAASASAAMDLAYPYESRRRPAPPRSEVPGPRLADEAAALAWLDAELPNLLAAAHDAAGHGRPEHATHQSATLHRHLRTRGRYHHARLLHELALRIARAAGQAAGELDALTALGSVHRLRGRYDTATACLDDALRLAGATADPVAELEALTGLGQVYNAQGKHAPAVDCFSRALDLAGDTAQPAGELDAYVGLGYVHLVQGRYGPAAECYRTALDLAAEHGHRPGELNARAGLAHVHLGQDRLEMAAVEFGQVLALATQTGNQAGEVNAVLGLGDVHYLQGCYQPAAELYERALTLARASEDGAAEVRAWTGLGDAYRLAGRYEAAAQAHRRAVDLAEASGARNYQLNAQLGLGRTYQAAGDPARAALAHQDALGLAWELDQQQDEVRALDGLAQAKRALGRADQARALWRRASRILAELGLAATEDVSAADIEANLAGPEWTVHTGPSTQD